MTYRAPVADIAFADGHLDDVALHGCFDRVAVGGCRRPVFHHLAIAQPDHASRPLGERDVVGDDHDRRSGVRGAGFNNIELITDRPIETNLREITETKRLFPKNPIIVSLMVETEAEWKDIIKRSNDSGCRRPAQ